MERIEVQHVFTADLDKAFSAITDIANWPKYWPGFVRIEDPANARWRVPGDKVTVVLELLGQERPMHMELDRFEENALVEYRTRQDGLPNAWHERHFKAVPGGFEYRGVVAFEPRPGLRGLLDRLFVKRGVERTLRKTVGNIEELLARG
jgi:uncharacterized protein YndB with AHSA1/START domain